MGTVTHEQANLLLKLYELRREPRLRQARTWYVEQFSASSVEELMKKYPHGSEENASIRMVSSYWDMVASLVNRGLIDDDLFFENTGEIWVVWERLRPFVPAWRAALKNPHIFAHLEELYKRMEAWQEKRAPGSAAAMRQIMEQMAQAKAKAAGE